MSAGTTKIDEMQLWLPNSFFPLWPMSPSIPQFMFGDNFLAAPVVDRGVTKWEVYLPTYGTGFGSRWLDVSSNFKVRPSW